MRVLLFDIDGTLMRSDGVGTRALATAFLETFALTDALQGVRPDGKTDPAIVREALARNGKGLRLGKAEMARFFELYAQVFEADYRSAPGWLAFWGAQRLLRSVVGRPNIHLGVATGNIERCARIKLDYAGFGDYFRFGGYGSDAEDRTDVIRIAIQRSGVPASSRSDIVVIGDTPQDVLHGRRAGARTLAVATGHYSTADLQACGADLVVEDLSPTSELLAFLRL